ncbi:hypothetical protein LVY72_18225 [Arthrobacter sp. I2-34]|uniref:DUF3040 domain-containing protein n=1 Tax=Arthrobacter hankyongi TaxID=2904801 RepID=A0ABS9LBI5_9MICC|nr:hypothetical protein [Arthrobacter hankyongi]MCG2623834.1 hypothetical protein [Arthrobacter hankyongi]
MTEPERSREEAEWLDLVARLESTDSELVPEPGPRDYTAADDDDEGYVPPEPAPLGAGEPLVVLAWLMVAGGPVGLLLIAMFWRGVPMAAVLGIIVLVIAAAGYLVSRLPSERDGYDDGAKV